MKVEITESRGDFPWFWRLRADNGKFIAEAYAEYAERRDAIHGACLALGLTLPVLPKGCKSQRLAHLQQRRGGEAEVYVSYGRGGQVAFAQWNFPDGDFIEFLSGGAS